MIVYHAQARSGTSILCDRQHPKLVGGNKSLTPLRMGIDIFKELLD